VKDRGEDEGAIEGMLLGSMDGKAVGVEYGETVGLDGHVGLEETGRRDGAAVG
jgi:hypothetical protein